MTLHDPKFVGDPLPTEEAAEPAPTKKAARQARYDATPKGQARHTRYNRSNKGDARYRRWTRARRSVRIADHYGETVEETEARAAAMRDELRALRDA